MSPGTGSGGGGRLLAAMMVVAASFGSSGNVANASAVAANAQEPSLTLAAFLAGARAHDPQFQHLRLRLTSLGYLQDLALAGGAYEMRLSTKQGFATEGGERTSQHTAELSKAFLTTGSRVTLSHNRTTRPDRNEDVSELRIEQSLYRNAFGAESHLLLAAQDQRARVIGWQVLEDYEGYLAEILGVYFTYHRHLAELATAQADLRQGLRLLANVKQKQRAAIASQTDTDLVALQVLGRRQSVAEKRQQLKASRQQLATILGSPPAATASAPAPVVWPPGIAAQGPYQAVTTQALEDLRPLRILAAQATVLQQELALATGKEDPELNLFAGISSDHSQRFAANVSRNETFIGLNVALPLGATYQNAVISQLRHEGHLNGSQQALMRRRIQRDDTALREQLAYLSEAKSLAAQSRFLAQKIYAAEEKRFDYAKVDLNRLIDLRSQVIAQGANEHRLNHEFQMALVNWLALTDQLVAIAGQL